MRLLILSPEYEGCGGGITTFYRALIPELQARGVEVRLIEGSACHMAEEKSLHRDGGFARETLEASRVRRWHGEFGHLAATPLLRRHLAAAWAMWEQADYGQDADIVEACDWGQLFIPPALEGARPLVVQCHGSVGQVTLHDPIAGEETQGVFTRLLEGVILSGVDAIQTYSCANAGYWKDMTGRSVVMIRPAWMRPAQEPAGELTGRGLVVGRIQRWKGPQVLCGALALLGRRAPEIDWIGRDTPWAVAHGSTSAHLARTYPEIWGRRIFRHAPVTPAEVHRRQAAAHFNVVPSTWDVFNFTAVEAMASGRPTMVSAGAGAAELIQDGVNGYTFPAGDAEKLAAVLDCMLGESAARLAEMGRAAQQTVRRALDPAAITEQRVAAYRAVIEGFSGPRPAVHSAVAEACRPASSPAAADFSFLQHVPLRKLVPHVAGRLSGKAARFCGWKKEAR